MKALLITQCLQNDFVKPLASGEPLPNQLHIGHEESRRLIGGCLEDGPIGRFMGWADAQTISKLAIIHIRDWHDPNSPEQASHLHQFEEHCIQDTDGAKFIFSEIHQPVENMTINSTTLNDFEGTALKSTLDKLTTQCSQENKLRVGLVGVWTEAKILFLAYELSTRYPHLEIAVCSALTASSSRSQHFLALQQLERIVGVTVIDSIGEFVQFLGGEDTPTQHKPLNESLQIESENEANLDAESEQLLRYLFRDCQKIALSILDGGFSGNLVAGVNSVDVHGHEQAPHVIKIGPRHLMAKERTAFEQIESVLGNNAPAIAEYADSQQKGAIKYRYASMGSGKTRSLQQCFQQGESQEKLHDYLDAVFDEQLGRLYRAAVSEKHNLLEYYCFDSQWAESVKVKIEDLLGDCPTHDNITLPGGKQIYNLYQFYKEELDKLPPMVGDYPFAFIHGDLNGANVIIDERDNVWLLDFFHTHRGHILKDFAKLENDLLYIYTPIDSSNDLELAYAFTDFLQEVKNPLSLPSTLPECFIESQFERTYETMKKLRKKCVQLMPKTPFRHEWLVAQLRYSVHTIGFNEPNNRQRVWALYSAALHARSILE